MLFREIPGLISIKQALTHAVQHNHVAHAQLFHGMVGSGNLALAMAFATYLNCEDRQVNEACGQCASCLKMSRLVHPDVHHIFPVPSAKDEIAALTPLWRTFLLERPYRNLTEWLDYAGAKGNQQGIIPIKEAHGLMQKISLKAYEGEYKILLIWQPELMNIESANALLKSLEEPPAKTIFLLVCNDANKLLTTILSRTQRVAIPAFKQEDITTYLLEKHHLDPKRAKQIAYLSEGSLSKAVVLSTNEDKDQHEWFANWMRQSYKPDFQQLVLLADVFDAQNKEAQKGLLAYGLSIFRDLFLYQIGASELVRLEGAELDFVQKFSKVIKSERVERIVDELNTAYYHLERNARAKIVFLDLSLTVAKLMK